MSSHNRAHQLSAHPAPCSPNNWGSFAGIIIDQFTPPSALMNKWHYTSIPHDFTTYTETPEHLRLNPRSIPGCYCNLKCHLYGCLLKSHPPTVAAICRNLNYVAFVTLICEMSILQFGASAVGGVQTFLLQVEALQSDTKRSQFQMQMFSCLHLASILKAEVKMEASIPQNVIYPD